MSLSLAREYVGAEGSLGSSGTGRVAGLGSDCLHQPRSQEHYQDCLCPTGESEPHPSKGVTGVCVRSCQSWSPTVSQDAWGSSSVAEWRGFHLASWPVSFNHGLRFSG